MLISFMQPDGHRVYVNPARVQHVKRNHTNAAAALIVFGKEHYVSVEGTVEDVATKLNASSASDGPC